MTAYPVAERRKRRVEAKAKKRRPDERKFHVWAYGVEGDAMVFVPGYALPSLANERLHWRSLATIKTRQRDLGRRLATTAADHFGGLRPPCTITFTRVGVRLLDDDNLSSAFKYIRDGVAAALGCGDGPEGPIVWRYEQHRAKGPAFDKVPAIEMRWSP